MSDIWFFGCWNEPGHHWWLPSRASHSYKDEPQIRWIDTGFAPRKFKDGCFMRRPLVKDPSCCFITEGGNQEDCHGIGRDTEEYPQGRFLLHHPVHEFTLMSWWDRCQGDRRGACNSNLLVRGSHAEQEMLDALQVNYPHVVRNLTKHDVKLGKASP